MIFGMDPSLRWDDKQKHDKQKHDKEKFVDVLKDPSNMNGVLVIDKPKHITSHDVVLVVKEITHAKKIGHLGTLDPSATGVLALVFNDSTKEFARLSAGLKEYSFTLVLGQSMTTDDDQGTPLETGPVPGDAAAKIEAILPSMTGEFMQLPPTYSAKKIRGRRACDKVREGYEVKLEPAAVFVKSIYISSVKLPYVNMNVECGKGTYVRSICRDIGLKLGSFGHAKDIRRLKSGQFSIEDAVPLADLIADKTLWRRKILPV